MISSPIERIDRWAGQRIEEAIRAHHRRRLSRVGRLHQLDPADESPWCVGHPAPRHDCDLEVLIDGAQALPRILETLLAARSHVHIAGWHLEPDFGLTRDSDARRLREVLAELAERIDVRVLLWAGAPLPVFTPDRAELRLVHRALTHRTHVKCALDGHERPMHCHHEKLVIVDGEIAFVGGIDLTALGGDRFDSSNHPMRSRLGWHDVACRISGPAVGDVEEHFVARWHEASGESLRPTPAPGKEGARTLQVVRTLPERVYPFESRGDFRVLEAYTRALRSARKLVYLESQFLWSSQIVDILVEKLRTPPSEDFRVVVLLPAKPNNGADTTRGQLGVLVDADDGAKRFLAATISARSGALAAPLYVHAKVGIVDDRWLTIGSANLNEHSLFNDTEMNVVSCDPDLARETRLRLWAEHLQRPVADVQGDTTEVIDELWRPIATEQLERRKRGDSPTHRLQELPGVSRRSMVLLGPLQGVLVDG